MGTEAAATLSLEINTGDAAQKLTSIAEAYGLLKQELSTGSSTAATSAMSTELAAVKTELAATKSQVDGMRRAYEALDSAVKKFKDDAKSSGDGVKDSATLAQIHAKNLQKAYEDISRQSKVTAASMHSVSEAMTHMPATFEGLSAYYDQLQLIDQAEIRSAAASSLRSTAILEGLTAQKAGLAEMAAYYRGIEAEQRQASVAASVAALREQEAAEAASGSARLAVAMKAIKAKQVAEQEYTSWFAAELAKRDQQEAAAAMRTAQQRSKMQAFTTDRLNRNLIAPASGTSAIAQDYIASGAVQGGGNTLATMEAAERTRLAKAVLEAAAAATTADAATKALTDTHGKAVPAVKAHTDATKGFSKAADEAHAFARGLSGSLGTLWMTYGSLIPLMAGAALAGGFMKATKAGSEFAYQLTFVKALGGATSESISEIGAAALTLSKNSMYGPVELANGLRILSQAGLDAKDSLVALPTVMQLATTGEMSMEQAAVTLVGVMNAFALSLTDLPHIGDMFAKAAALSQTSVQGMTEAMKSASVVHEQYGASIEDTATAITLLAKVNINGTAAGTAYRNMLKDLYTPSKQAERVMEQLGLKTKDANGELRAAPEIMFELQTILARFTKGSQSDILGKMFSQRGGKEAIAILGQTKESWDALKEKISNSDGFMSGVTAELEMTTKGRFKQALNTMQSNMIGAFDASEGSVRNLSNALMKFADSPEFVTGINAIVGSMASLAEIVVKILPLLIDLGIAWAVFKGVGLAVAGITAAAEALTGLGVSIGIVSSVSAFAGGGLNGLKLGLAATTSAAAAAAGATGLGAVGGALALLTNPITWAVAGIAAIGYALYQSSKEVPESVRATQAFMDVLDRQNAKTEEAIKLLTEKNRLQREGTTGDVDAIQAELASLDKKIAAAKTGYDAVPTDGTEAKPGDLAKAAEYADLLKKRNEIEDKLGIARTNQARMNEQSLVSVLQDTEQQVAKLVLDAEHQKKTLKTEQIQAVIDSAKGQVMTPTDIRLLKDKLARMTDDLRQSMRGAGNENFKLKPNDHGMAKAEQAAAMEEFNAANKMALDSYNSEKKITNELYKDKLISESEFSTQRIANELVYQDAVSEAGAKALKILNGLEDSAEKESQKLNLKTAQNRITDRLAEQAWMDEINQREQQRLSLIKEQTDARTFKMVTVPKEVENISGKYQKAWNERDIGLMDPRAQAELKAREDVDQAYKKLIVTKREYLTAVEEELKSSRLSDFELGEYSIATKILEERQALLAGQIAFASEAMEGQSDSAAKLAGDLVDHSRTFESGWNNAFTAFSNNANNAAETGKTVFNEMSSTMSNALVQFATTGKLSFKSLGLSMLQTAAKVMADKAVAGMMNMAISAIGSMFGGGGTFGTTSIGGNMTNGVANVSTPWAKGGVFSSPSLHEYANTVQTTPKTFAFAKGGVFAEAGPEAVMPLSRDASGRLGVKSQGGGAGDVSISIVVNAESGSSETKATGNDKDNWNQFAVRVKGLIIEQITTEKRPGGLLYA
jgi:TP901 family phage tail tape measure protein/lambda family phage tail tape measure protein